MREREIFIFIRRSFFSVILFLCSIPFVHAVSYYPSGFYVEGGGALGVMDARGFDNVPKTAKMTQGAGRKKGVGYLGNVGYSFKTWPISIALSTQKRRDLSYKPEPIFVGGGQEMSSKLKNKTLMLNGYYNIPLDNFVLYGTCGIGMASNTITGQVKNGDQKYSLKNSSRSLVWQFGVGIRFHIINNLFVTTAYQHILLGKAKWGPWGEAGSQRVLKASDLSSDEFLLTVSYYFGHGSRPVPSLIDEKDPSEKPSLMRDE